MTEDMQVRNLSPRTQSTYLLQVSLFARHFGKPPHLFGPEQIRDYQLFLATEKKLAPGSIGIAVSALRFLYRVTLKKAWDIEEVLPAPRPPHKLPVVARPEEVLHFLGCVAGVRHRAILTACYAAGLRISEAVSLRPTDIDSRRMVARVDQGKGRKDRYVMLSPRLLEILRDYWWRTRPAGGWPFPGLIPGQHFGRGAVSKASRAALRRSGIPKPLTPRYAMRSPCICSNPASTCAPSSCCSATAASPPPPATCNSPAARSAPPPARSTCCPSRKPPPTARRRPDDPPGARSRGCLPSPWGGLPRALRP